MACFAGCFGFLACALENDAIRSLCPRFSGTFALEAALCCDDWVEGVGFIDCFSCVALSLPKKLAFTPSLVGGGVLFGGSLSNWTTYLELFTLGTGGDGGSRGPDRSLATFQ